MTVLNICSDLGNIIMDCDSCRKETPKTAIFRTPLFRSERPIVGVLASFPCNYSCDSLSHTQTFVLILFYFFAAFSALKIHAFESLMAV